MAAGYKDFTAGAALTAADLEDYCQNQTVMRFASTAARDTALSSVKTNGMMAYTTGDSTLWLYDGTNWVRMAEPAQTYTPTFANFTLGNGTINVAKYWRSDGWCELKVVVTLGTTSTMGSNPTISLPVAAADNFEGETGDVLLYDSSATTRCPGKIGASGTSNVGLYAQNAAGTYLTETAVTAAIPFTWATSDVFEFTFRYQMTTRYS